MKQILLGTCMAVLLAVGFAGCQSAGLKSDDAATRMKAVREIKEQDDLLDVARGKEYPNDNYVIANSKNGERAGPVEQSAEHLARLV